MKLEDFGEILAYRSEDELIFRCPNCKKKSLSVNTAKGLFNCFKCGEFKGRFDVDKKVERLRVDIPKQLEVTKFLINTLSLSNNHREYLISRDIQDPDRYDLASIPVTIKMLLYNAFSEDYLIEAGIVNEDKKLSTSLSPGRIFIPYYSCGELVGYKTRQSPSEDSFKSGAYKYAFPRGSVAHRYPYTTGDEKDIIIITEGEFKAIVGAQQGFSCWSLSGIVPSQSTIRRIKRLRKRFYNKKAYLILDRDYNFDNKIEILLANLRLSKVFGVPFVLLPNLGEKIGLDDYFKKYSYEDMLDLMNYYTLVQDKKILELRDRVEYLRSVRYD